MDITPLLSGDPAGVVTVTVGGRTFRAGRRTAAHLARTHEKFANAFPELELTVAQGCYNTGYEPSAGTHDKDGVIDWYVQRRGGGSATQDDYWRVQRWLRGQGWGCWFRHTGTWASRGSWHVHGVSLGCPGPLGVYVDGGLSTLGRLAYTSQIADYYRHTYGLANQHAQDADKSAFPGDDGPPPWPTGTPAQWRAAIDRTVFDYPAWKEEHEMNAEEHGLLKQIANDTAAMRAYNARETERSKKRHDAVMAALDELVTEVGDSATKTQVAKARQRIMEALAEEPEAPADQPPA